ncbi:uncharacterized protein EMH_0084590 [Eimeria mitis]|uniref:DNA2/NAM7 helicase helicase domain-containing protein n=1 Tax=Eimeria mitis TaxID=44415 RepID=U6KBQ7_9EIME|nr:uncharacterized protein EMH_0084590 [Eimeria mitis]CDJ33682.1 hypothetical protein, conserved [Eimeria mitis]
MGRFGAETGREAETTVTQLIMLDVSSEDAEAVVCKCSSGGGSWMLNEEQQRVIIAISRWFGYTDGRRPFGPRDEAQLHEKQHGDAEGCENQVNRSENSQELQQGDSSIFSQDNKHSALQSKSQATPSEKQEKAGDLNSSAVAVQGSNTGGAPAVSPDDDDIADICLYADDLDELQLPGEECSGVGIASAEDRRPEENSGFRLDQPSAVVKDRNVQDPRTATLASTAHDSLAVGSEAKTCTPLQDENSKVGVADGEKQFKAQPAQHPPKETGPPATLEPPPVSVTLASSLASTAVNMPASSAPVFLVQGVFGAGKTTMLAASLATLCRLLDLAKSRSRVLLVCATNAAVDGVLLRLLRQYECCDFARIGRLSEMQPALLPYAICSSAARNTAVHEFKAVLSGLLSAPGARTNLATMAKQLLQSIDSGSFPPSMQVGQTPYDAVSAG